MMSVSCACRGLLACVSGLLLAKRVRKGLLLKWSSGKVLRFILVSLYEARFLELGGLNPHEPRDWNATLIASMFSKTFIVGSLIESRLTA